MKRASDNNSEHGLICRRRFLHRAGMLSAICVATPVLAGCEILAARDDERYTVDINENRRFEPASLTIPVGSTVIWDNKTETRHGVTTDASELEGAEEIVLPIGVWPFSSGDLFAGETWSLTFTVPGSYVYVCPFHHEHGMIGSVVVEE